ncbi:MAG: mono/diheme cytochrome c family protein [Kiritimatiellia bacterium]|jgi:mono/diheme cytochrome c family protein
MWRKAIIGTLGLIGLAVAGVAILLTTAHLWAEGQLVRVRDIEVLSVPTSHDPQVLARGEMVGRPIAMCVNCHGDDLGGSDWMTVPGLVKLYAPNITGGLGGPTNGYSADDWVGAIRHGIRTKGTGLTAMPVAPG